jgi:uncharacterized protein (TIGR00661 family)
MNLPEVENETILYACNDWGLGHLARSIPIIQQLLRQNNTIYFAGNEKQNSILNEYFPTIHFLALEGYDFQFSGSGKWGMEMTSNFFRLKRKIAYELNQVRIFCQSFPITRIVSDHRYGFRSKSIPSIFVTHQVTLPVKGIQKLANHWHTKQLQKFTALWILDDEKHTYAGKLSTPTTNLRLHYIGIQSRFSEGEYPSEDFVLAVISGPEPYAYQFFQDIVSLAKTSNQEIKCICPAVYPVKELPVNLEVFHHLAWKEMDELFYRCSAIISRSGYTTIMDVARLHKKATYFPTPGQSEQEYLFKLHG